MICMNGRIAVAKYSEMSTHIESHQQHVRFLSLNVD